MTLQNMTWNDLAESIHWAITTSQIDLQIYAGGATEGAEPLFTASLAEMLHEAQRRLVVGLNP